MAVTRAELDAARAAMLPGEILEQTIARLVRERDAAVLAEREACAEIAEACDHDSCAAAIRARK